MIVMAMAADLKPLYELYKLQKTESAAVLMAINRMDERLKSIEVSLAAMYPGTSLQTRLLPFPVANKEAFKLFDASLDDTNVYAEMVSLLFYFTRYFRYYFNHLCISFILGDFHSFNWWKIKENVGPRCGQSGFISRCGVSLHVARFTWERSIKRNQVRPLFATCPEGPAYMLRNS